MSIPTFEFAAVKGIQGGRGYYLASIPFSILSRLLAIDAGNTLDRSQRDVDAKRAKAVSKYIIENSTSFVIPGLTGVINAENIGFIEHCDGSFVGTMQVPMDAEIKLFDGQHRAVGIMEAIKECAAVRSSTVPVQLFTDMTLADRQQAFSDINSHAKSVSASLNHAYNLRASGTQALAALAREPMFHGIIEYQRNAVSGKSPKIFSLKTLIEASRLLLSVSARDDINEEQIELAKVFWNYIQFPAGWTTRQRNPSFTGDIGREELITFHSVALLAMGRLGRMLFNAGYSSDDNLRLALGHLSSLSFKRTDPRWQGVCVNDDLTMLSNVSAQKALAEAMFEHINQEYPAERISEQPSNSENKALSTISDHLFNGDMDFAIAAYLTTGGHESELSADDVAAANAYLEDMDAELDEASNDQRVFRLVRAAMYDAKVEAKSGVQLLSCLRAIGQQREISPRSAKSAVKAVLEGVEA